MLRNMARLHRCVKSYSFIFFGTGIFFYCFVWEVISKTRASGLITGSKHLETIKALVLRPRAFICFSLFGTPDKTLALVFDILLENLPIVAYHHPNNLSVIFVRAQLPGTHNCNNMPGPLPVLFGAIVVNAPHAPILTRVYIETAVSENFLSIVPLFPICYLSLFTAVLPKRV